MDIYLVAVNLLFSVMNFYPISSNGDNVSTLYLCRLADNKRLPVFEYTNSPQCWIGFSAMQQAPLTKQVTQQLNMV